MGGGRRLGSHARPQHARAICALEWHACRVVSGADGPPCFLLLCGWMRDTASAAVLSSTVIQRWLQPCNWLAPLPPTRDVGVPVSHVGACRLNKALQPNGLIVT